MKRTTMEIKSTRKNNKQAISLIVLIITIIVMVILAGAIILTLNNNEIIGKASEAVEKADEATVKEIAQLGWADAYASGARTTEQLKEGVKTALARNNIKLDDYLINITTDGVTIKLLSNAWIQEGFTVKKGNTVLEIGDSIAYDETNNNTVTGLTNVEWKVLGADADGNLLIMSYTNVKASHRLGYETTMTDSTKKLKEAQNDWLTGAEQLDKVCVSYGQGEGALGARSIRIEDVDKITEYDKTTSNKGTIIQYGIVVTYSYNGTTNPAYSSEIANGTLANSHDTGFYYYNGKNFVVAKDLTEKTEGTLITLKNTAYGYNAADLTTMNSTDNEKIYLMLFGEGYTYYWLASNNYFTYPSYVSYGVFYVGNDSVSSCSLWGSSGISNTLDLGVRAVVTLSSDIQLTGSSASGWSY